MKKAIMIFATVVLIAVLTTVTVFAQGNSKAEKGLSKTKTIVSQADESKQEEVSENNQNETAKIDSTYNYCDVENCNINGEHEHNNCDGVNHNEYCGSGENNNGCRGQYNNDENQVNANSNGRHGGCGRGNHHN